ncbi:FecR family protein [Sphingobacterium rhinopitheci]|uniref:FecR family protein n=1 Tax=Sphingobacterium rhinopitheci TaxID=2781960 RepID=UPI001F51AD29|nr:FecR family protein [Sphingobacterium rhinopitheci]MCI0922335.1 FecR domain-containing protein [Sphingobacterium rhinopitheci]
MSTSSELAVLLKKYIEGSILPAEQQELENCMAHDTKLREYVEQLLQDDTLIHEYEDWLVTRKVMDDEMLQSIKNQTFRRIHQNIEEPPKEEKLPSKHVTFRWLRIAVISTAAICLLAGIRFVYEQSDTENNLISSTLDLAPATNKTTLTLSNGEKVELRNDQQGIMLGKGIKYTDGTAVTDLDAKELSGYNATIHVPKGSTYSVVLADGSRVMLNAMSTLTYPLTFDQNSREVTLSGEGYFEIVKKMKAGKRVPFIVHTAEQQVSVTGTQFNIRAYADEKSTISTLVEGGITVSHGQQQVHLQPNEQASTSSGNIHKQVVDANAYIAWTKDKFLFHETELVEVLANISRWYDVEIHDLSNREDMHFYGEIARNKKLSEVLRLLEKSGVKFQIKKQHKQHHLYVIK